MNNESILKIINQLHLIESKLKSQESFDGVERNFTRIGRALEGIKIVVQNPLGEAYDETRFDCEASISGESTDNLIISEVIKPIVYKTETSGNELIQRGIVIAESKSTSDE